MDNPQRDGAKKANSRKRRRRPGPDRLCDKVTTMYLTSGQYRWFNEHADATGCSFASLVRRALDAYILSSGDDDIDAYVGQKGAS